MLFATEILITGIKEGVKGGSMVISHPKASRFKPAMVLDRKPCTSLPMPCLKSGPTVMHSHDCL